MYATLLKLSPPQRQTLLFSAIFQKEVEQLAKQTLKKPQRVSIGIIKPVHTVSHALYPVPQHLKRVVLLELLKKTDTNSVLIFTRTKHRARRLEQQLSKAGYRTTSLHGNRTQGQRQRALAGFKSGQFQIMVATDIAARGLDIESISHVINFDMPDTEDAYIHRIGRTGRAKKSREAFTLSTPDDEQMIRRLEKIMKQTLGRRWLDNVDYDIPAPKHNPRQNRQKRKSHHSKGYNQPRGKPSQRQHHSRKGS